MPVNAVLKKSLLRNGVGTFIQPCHKISIQYCNWGGSSKSIRELLTNGSINEFALKNSNIFFEVVKKSGHPSIKFSFNNDKEEIVDVKNKSNSDILRILKDHSQKSGNELFKFNHKVMSNNESVRGVWSPMHEHKGYRYKI